MHSLLVVLVAAMHAQTRVPPASAGHVLVYHDSLQSVLLVNAGLGGMTSPPSASRTVLWRWTGQTWVILDSLGPPIRNLGGVAYDTHRNVLVVYGGTYSEALSYDDTWEWSQTGGWQRKNVTGPGKRDHTEMAYDAERRRVVLFGGQIGPASFPSDTWEWDGKTWQRASTDGPRGRVHHALAYDPFRKRVVMFGGLASGSGDLGDSWAWTGSEWSPLAPATTPRTHARLAATSRGVVLFGGFSAQAPFILLDGGVWREDIQPNAPSSRYLSALAFDPRRNVTVLFGGGEPSSDRLFADTWEYATATGWRRIQ